MTTEIEMRNFKILPTPQLADQGKMILARFDFNARGFRLNGCALLHSEKGWQVWSPSKLVWIAPDLRREVKEQAKAAYAAMGGAVGTG